VIIVDNGGTDDTLNLVEKYKAAMGDKLKIVKLGKNLGAGCIGT
jgi:glycosyltransferase involved in cell wall biosynthesis